jgi:hypothetical protein
MKDEGRMDGATGKAKAKLTEMRPGIIKLLSKIIIRRFTVSRVDNLGVQGLPCTKWADQGLHSSLYPCLPSTV